MIPPAVLKIHVIDDGKKVIRLWLPLFLLWPLVLVVMLALPVLMLVGIFIPRKRRLRRVFLASPWWITAFCAFRGFRVDVKDGKDIVYVEAI